MDTEEVIAWLLPVAAGVVGWQVISPWAGVVAAVGALGAVWLAIHGVP